MTQTGILLMLLGAWISFTFAKVLRDFEGKDDVNNRYPFAVSLRKENGCVYKRSCTGSLIAPEWVLTAAHCIVPTAPSIVRFGDMTAPQNETNSYRKVINVFPHPKHHYENIPLPVKFRVLSNDIGLILIEKLEGVNLARVSGVDYKSLSGLPVTHAGFGKIKNDENDREWMTTPLQIGEGVIANCNPLEKSLFSPGLCVTPKCNTITHTGHRDSGGPLMFRDTIIGVASGISPSTSVFCPVSPFLEWINMIMFGNHVPVN